MNTKLTKAEIMAALANNNNNASAAAREVGIPARTFRRWVADNDLRGEVFKKKAGSVSEVKPRKNKLVKSAQKDGSIDENDFNLTDDQLLIKRGFDPSKYDITKVALTERDAGTASAPKVNRGISIDVVPKPLALEPAFGGRPLNFTYSRGYKGKSGKRETELVLVLGDYHAPYFEKELHEKSLKLIRKYKPDRIIVNGDLVDFPTVGRHRKVTNLCTASANECIQSGGQILADIRQAAGADCIIEFIFGNHDGWLNNYIIDKAGAVYDLAVFGEEEPVWSFEKLLRLDDLNIQTVGTAADWQKAFVQLTDHLVVFHGGPIHKDAGGSALKAMIDNQAGYITNHIHRLAVVSKTIWLPDGTKRTYQGGEGGCMCQAEQDGFPAYMEKPNWQQGFLAVEIEKSGHYSIDTATYQNGALMFRGEVF